MNPQQLFKRTQWRLATWYVIVISLLLGVCGVGFYQIVLQTQRQVLRQKLESLAGTLHDTIEPVLTQPGKLNNNVIPLLPGLCLQEKTCQPDARWANNSANRHIVGVFRQQGYYVRFVDRAGQIIANVGQPPDLTQSLNPSDYWQLIQGVNQEHFYQVSMLLRTQAGLPWGYVQVGRSLQEWDDFLAMLRLLLLLGLPLAMLSVGGASWGLSGLAMRPIYQSYRQMQQFTSDAAHELRTPLTVLHSALDDSKRVENLTEIHQSLEMMERQTQRLSQLVKDLLLICRLEQSVPLHVEPCNLGDLLSDLIEELSGVASASDITLKLDIKTDQPVVTSGDLAQLYRLISNLMTNAIHYTPPGGFVLISLEKTHEDAVIQVQDNGIGISLEEQKHIFERFYRVQGDRSRLTGGSGLGLSIARAIAQAHQGRIKVKSEVGKGSTFTVYLPLCRTASLVDLPA